MTTLRSLSNDVTRIASKTRGSLVQVFGGRRAPASGAAWDGAGLVVTAAHALEDDDGLSLLTERDDRVEAELVGRDPRTDVALLRAPLDLPAPLWSETTRLEAGELAVVVAPTRTALVGVSALDSPWTAPSGGRLDRYIETDPKRFRGFSGSLLVSADGGTLGMNTTGLARRTSLTIPTETLRRVTEHLVKHGEVRRGYLGITTTSVRLPDSVPVDERGAAGQRLGLLVLSVQDASPAADAGLLLGDVLLAIEGRALETPMALLSLLSDDLVGKTVDVRLLRAGSTSTLRVEVGARAAS